VIPQYVLAPYVRVGFQKNVLHCGFGSIQIKVSNPLLQHSVLTAMKHWTAPSRVSDTVTLLESLGTDKVTIDETMNLLTKSPLLIPAHSYAREQRYSRHGLFYNLSGAEANEVQKRLERSHVTILGCGGIGNLVSVSLATAGIGHITLVDNDQIEISNLTRQIMFTEADVGAEKTITLQAALRQRASECTVDVYSQQIRKAEDLSTLPSCDLLIVSADMPEVMSWVNRFAVKSGTPFINIGYVNDVAVWGPFVIPGETGCFDCTTLVARDPVSAELKGHIDAINRHYQAPSIGPVNMAAAAAATLDILKYLGGFGTVHSKNRRIGLWTHSLEQEFQECIRNSQCHTCGATNVDK
jgi:molybdopterin-synthase adenylyltransferase